MTVLGITFNYIDLAIVLIMVIAAIIGFCRGLLINVINFIRISVGIFLCFFISNNAAQPVYDTLVKPRALATINEKIVTSGNIDEIIGNLNSFLASLPKAVASSFNVKSVDITSSDIAQSILQNVFEPALLALVKAALFILVFLVFFIATGIIIYIAQRSSKKRDEKRGHKTIVKKTDKVLGLLFGLLKASVIVLAITSVLMYILSLKPELATGNTFWSSVSTSKLIEIINGINPFNAITEGYI